MITPRVSSFSVTTWLAPVARAYAAQRRHHEHARHLRQIRDRAQRLVFLHVDLHDLAGAQVRDEQQPALGVQADCPTGSARAPPRPGSPSGASTSGSVSLRPPTASPPCLPMLRPATTWMGSPTRSSTLTAPPRSGWPSRQPRHRARSGGIDGRRDVSVVRCSGAMARLVGDLARDHATPSCRRAASSHG